MDPYKYRAMREKAFEITEDLPGPYDSTYKSSYTQVPTYYLSPLYDDDRKSRARKEHIQNDFAYLNEPQRSYREQYGTGSPRPYWNTPDDRFEYPRSYQEQQEREHSPPWADEGSRWTRFHDPESRLLRPRDFQDQLVHDADPDDDDLKPICCDNWHSPDKPTNQVITKLACPHKYCPECFHSLRTTDNITRHGEVILHYQCNIPICKKWTSCKRLVRLDPFGRRMVTFHDVAFRR